MSETTNRPAGFEVEAGSVEEFLRLLDEREAERKRGVLPSVEPLPRTAVYVAPLQDIRHGGNGMPWPSVRRYVLAGFAYGEDLVSYRVDVSSGMEFPDGPDRDKPRELHNRIYEDLKTRIGDWAVYQGHERVRVLDGYLHRVGARAEASS